MNNSEYHSHPALGRSMLCDLLKSPALFKAKYIDKTLQQEQTPELRFGSLVHVMKLEPDKFEEEFVLADCADRRSQKKYEEAMEKAAQTGATVITKKEYAAAKELCDALTFDFTGAKFEQTYMFEYEGIQLKIRPDVQLADGTIIDLKTTSSILAENFTHSIHAYNYDFQFYMMRLFFPDSAFKWACVEKQPPYLHTIYEAGKSVFQLGEKKFKRAIALYKSCSKLNLWPINPDEGKKLEVPSYILARYL